MACFTLRTCRARTGATHRGARLPGELNCANPPRPRGGDDVPSRPGIRAPPLTCANVPKAGRIDGAPPTRTHDPNPRPPTRHPRHAPARRDRGIARPRSPAAFKAARRHGSSSPAAISRPGARARRPSEWKRSPGTARPRRWASSAHPFPVRTTRSGVTCSFTSPSARPRPHGRRVLRPRRQNQAATLRRGSQEGAAPS